MNKQSRATVMKAGCIHKGSLHEKCSVLLPAYRYEGLRQALSLGRTLTVLLERKITNIMGCLLLIAIQKQPNTQ